MKLKALGIMLLAAAALPSMALAQVESTPTASLMVDRVERVTRIPDYFTCDNSIQIAVLTNNKRKAEIYDLEFNLLRSFDVADGIIDMDWNDGHGSEYRNYICFTQSFFNDDDKYEYLTATYDDNGWTLSIVSEDGTIVQTIGPFEHIDVDAIDLWSFWDGYDWHTSYLKIGSSVNDDGYDIQFFRVGKNSISGIAEQQSKMLTMQATREGDILNVGFEPSSTDRTLNVVSANGMNVLSCSVSAGESAANIDTRRFVSGVYVVTLQEPGKAAVETTKIIIR